MKIGGKQHCVRNSEYTNLSYPTKYNIKKTRCFP